MSLPSPMQHLIDKITSMGFWQSDVEITPITGGLTNQNFRVRDRGQNYFVRMGSDIPEHGIMRFNELAASRAAFEAGISPAVLHAEDGIMVLAYLDAEPLTAADLQKPEILVQAITLLKHCHQQIPNKLCGPSLVFWVFQVIRSYAQNLNKAQSPNLPLLKKLIPIAEQLEQAVGKIRLVFAHNDLLAANFMHDGSRLWLIDWDYAGFNSALFDLGGLASNNEFSAEHEQYLLQNYYAKVPGQSLLKRYSAMKCASLLRESLWSMVSEMHSVIDFDYAGYTKSNLAQFDQAWQLHQQQYH